MGSLPELIDGRPLALVLGVLEDKDAAEHACGAAARVSERAWFTAPAERRALSPAALQSLARQLGFERRSRSRAGAGAQEARRWARARDGAVLVTGSVYLVGELLGAVDGSGSVSGRAGGLGGRDEMNDDGPSVLTMIGAVALIVALVILVFFAAGYGFGRLFL